MKKICFLGASQHFHALSHAPLRSSLPAYPPLLPPSLSHSFAPCHVPKKKIEEPQNTGRVSKTIVARL